MFVYLNKKCYVTSKKMSKLICPFLVGKVKESGYSVRVNSFIRCSPDDRAATCLLSKYLLARRVCVVLSLEPPPPPLSSCHPCGD